MVDALNDPRILDGMAAQLEMRHKRLQSGDKPLGWKVGFGSPAAMKNLGTQAPLVGFLTEGIRLRSGAAVSVAGWKKPVLEPEIALHIASDLAGGSDRKAVQDAIGAIGPAIELADVNFAPEDVKAILAGNIYNRHVVLGEKSLVRQGSAFEGLVGRVFRNGEAAAATDDPQALTGDALETVALVATLLQRLGEQLRAGEIIILGSIVPPLVIEKAEVIRYELEPIGEIAVELTV